MVVSSASCQRVMSNITSVFVVTGVSARQLKKFRFHNLFFSRVLVQNANCMPSSLAFKTVLMRSCGEFDTRFDVFRSSKVCSEIFSI